MRSRVSAMAASRVAGMLAVGVAVACALVASGCKSDDIGSASPSGADTGSFEIVRSYESGALSVVLQISHARIDVAGQVEARLQAIAPESATVDMPGPEADMGEWRIADYRAAQPRLVNGDCVIREDAYLLEPFLAGDYVIPPLKVSLAGQGATVETEPTSVTVVSLLPPAATATTAALAAALAQLRDIAPPVELPPLRILSLLPWLAAGAVALIALAAFGLLMGRRRATLASAPPTPAHVIALRELEALLREGLLARGELNLFYTRLSGVLRRYLERRFGLNAPCQTTEEFLARAADAPALSGARERTLREFLVQCDLAKFSGETPAAGEAQRSADTCRRFIEQTQEAPMAPALPGAGRMATDAL